MYTSTGAWSKISRGRKNAGKAYCVVCGSREQGHGRMLNLPWLRLAQNVRLHKGFQLLSREGRDQNLTFFTSLRFREILAMSCPGKVMTVSQVVQFLNMLDPISE